MTVLIVDDHPINLKLLRAVLEAEGVTVVEAPDGIEALALLVSRSVDAVISDILMPRMDGYRLCREIRADPHLFAMPFIFYTATYTSPGDERFALEIGADRFLKKPASSALLMAALREAKAVDHPAPIAEVTAQELSLMKEYSGRLVEKLEQKNAELEQSSVDLQAAHEQLRHLLAHSPAVIYQLTFDGAERTLSVLSDNLESLLGASAAEVSSYEWWRQRLHPEDRERVLAAVDQAVSGNGGYVTEYRIRHKDGSYCWVEDCGRIARDAAARPRHAVGLWVDVNERKRAEEFVSDASAHQVRDLRKKVVLELAVLAGLVLAASMLALHYRPAENFARWTSHGARSSLYELLPAAVLAGLGMALFACRRWRETVNEMSGEQRARSALQTLHADLDTQVKRRTSQLTSANAKLRSEIETREKLQAEVELREGRLNAFFGGAGAGLAILDDQLRFVQINRTLAEITGLPIEAHLGKPLEVAIPTLAPVIAPLMQQVLKTGTPVINREHSGETPMQPGVIRHWLASYFPVPDGHGRPSAVGAIIVETSEQKRAEQKGRDQLDELRRWQNVMLDREARVGQLKSEVNELLRQVNQPARYGGEGSP